MNKLHSITFLLAQTATCVISGFCRDVNDICALLGFYTA